MKFFKNKLKILLLLFISIALIVTLANSKIGNKNRSKKFKQIITNTPVITRSVVSPIVEADEIPGHTVINVPVTPKPLPTRVAQIGEWNVPLNFQHASPNIAAVGPHNVVLSSATNNIQPAVYNTQGLDLNQLGINHIDIQGDSNIQNPNLTNNILPNNVQKLADSKTLLNKGNSFLHKGNVDKALEYYAAALKNADNDEEDEILNSIAKNLQNTPKDFAKKLEEIIDDKNKKQLKSKIKLMLQKKLNRNVSTNQSLTKKNNKNSEEDFPDHEIITLEPKKRILKLDNDNPVQNKENLKTEDKPLKDLLAWAKVQKLETNKIKIVSQKQKTFNIIAVEKIKKNDKILHIPNKFVISSKHASLKPLCSKISKISYFKSNYDKICMAVFLLTSKDNNFKPYINFIHDDTNYESFPFFYNKKQLKLLEGSYFSSLIAAREEGMNFEYKILKEDKILPENITIQAYLKSRVNVLSKNFSVKDSSDKTLSIMVPFANLFNHSSNKENSKLEMGKDEIVIEATEAIKKNEPIYSFYGKFSNYHYLLYYGFVEANNSIPIQISLDLKIKNGAPHKKYEEVVLSPDMKINSTLKNFRVIVSKFNTAQKQKSKNFANPVSLENETESLRLLKIGLKTQILRYPSSIDQDKQTIKTSSGDKNAYNILTVLIEEKKIIIKYFDAALIFYKMLKKVIENENQPLLLTKKISNLIQRKKYLKNYFNLLVKTFDLKIKLNNGQDDGDNLDINDNDLQDEFLDQNPDNFDQFDSEDLNNNSYNDYSSENIIDNPSELETEPTYVDDEMNKRN